MSVPASCMALTNTSGLVPSAITVLMPPTWYRFEVKPSRPPKSRRVPRQASSTVGAFLAVLERSRRSSKTWLSRTNGMPPSFGAAGRGARSRAFSRWFGNIETPVSGSLRVASSLARASLISLSWAATVPSAMAAAMPFPSS